MRERGHGDAGRQSRPFDLEGGKSRGGCAFLECAARGFGRGISRVAAMAERGGFGRENLLRFVQLRALKPFQPRDLAPANR